MCCVSDLVGLPRFDGRVQECWELLSVFSIWKVRSLIRGWLRQCDSHSGQNIGKVRVEANVAEHITARATDPVENDGLRVIKTYVCLNANVDSQIIARIGGCQ